MIPVSLEDMLGGGSTSTGRLNGWLIALFVAIGAILLLICLFAFCIKRKQLCFNGMTFSCYPQVYFEGTKSDDSYSEPKAKAK